VFEKTLAVGMGGILANDIRMAAHDFEVHEAVEEVVDILNLRTIKEVKGKTFVLEKMVPDDDGCCMSCGNCFECDNCYGICPDNAITKLGPGNRFEFKYDYCKGCAMCATECLCGAIEIVPEEI